MLESAQHLIATPSVDSGFETAREASDGGSFEGRDDGTVDDDEDCSDCEYATSEDDTFQDGTSTLEGACDCARLPAPLRTCVVSLLWLAVPSFAPSCNERGSAAARLWSRSRYCAGLELRRVGWRELAAAVVCCGHGWELRHSWC
jgi:hypothetical protein